MGQTIRRVLVTHTNTGQVATVTSAYKRKSRQNADIQEKVRRILGWFPSQIIIKEVDQCP